MNCNNCGAALVNTARFCARCGSPTFLDQAETQVQRNNTTRIDPEPTANQGPAAYPACAYHTNVAAAGACAGCGYFFCRACMYHYAGRNYCANCWARLNPAMQPPPYYQHPYGYGYNPNYFYAPAVDRKKPELALFLSFIMPGAGQLYNGEFVKGILFFLAFWVLVWVIIGWLFWIIAMVDAHQSAQNINLRNRV